MEILNISHSRILIGWIDKIWEEKSSLFFYIGPIHWYIRIIRIFDKSLGD